MVFQSSIVRPCSHPTGAPAEGSGVVSCHAVLALIDMLILASEEEGRETSQWLPATLMSLGVIIMLIIWTMSMRNRGARRNQQYVSPREQIDRIKSGHRTRDIENALTAEFVSSATEIAARLENKAERLEQLIQQADARIAQLVQFHKQPADTVQGPETDHDSSSREPNPEHEPATPTARETESQQDHTPTPPDHPVPPTPPLDPLARAVHELADEGKGPLQIAQELDEQVGKVELILALRQQ